MPSATTYMLSNISLETVKDHNVIGKQDPYIVFNFKDYPQKVITSTAKGAGVSAQWEESYTISAPEGQGATNNDTVICVVQNKNALTPDGHIGSATFTLSSGPTQRLALLNKKSKETGTLCFTVAASDAGVDVSVPTASTAVAGTIPAHPSSRAAASTTCTDGSCAIGRLGVAPGCINGLGPQSGDEVVCDTKKFVKVEDRAIDREVKTVIREHRPVEKEFEVVTRPTGEEHLLKDQIRTEIVGSNETVIAAEQGTRCGGVPTTIPAGGQTMC